MAKSDIPGFRIYLARARKAGRRDVVGKVEVGPDLESSTVVDVPADSFRIDDQSYRIDWVIFTRDGTEVARFAVEQVAGWVNLSI